MHVTQSLPAEAGALRQVRLRRLKLSCYRNYRHVQFDFDGSHVVLSGHNGAGKTNILEAISLLSPGRGLRRAPYGEMKAAHGQAEQNSAEFAIHARLESADYGEVDIGSGGTWTASGQAGRRVRINSANVSAEDLLDYCRIIWLVPAMDGLFTGAAGERRRFVDRMVLATHPLHGRLVLDYEKAMRARGRLLVTGSPDTRWLGALETQMAELGVAIAAARLEMISSLQALIERNATGSAFPQASLLLDGSLESQLADNVAALDVEETFRAALRGDRSVASRSGRTGIGPHRSDLKVFHAAKGVPAALASTGEQKALLTGLILTHARLTAQLVNQTPLLLLDEIAAHLDQHRRAALFDLVDEMGVQAFMTGTDRALFEHLEGKAQFFTLSEGQVV